MTDSKLTLDAIQQRFPIGDYIEYQTGNGFFSGMIIGYEQNRGISLDLGDRRFPVDSEKFFVIAEKYHIPAETKNERLKIEISLRVPVPILEQLTLF
ncbi:MAG: hypothetical protein WD469_12355 [Paenibacillaceae bacterium]